MRILNILNIVFHIELSLVQSSWHIYCIVVDSVAVNDRCLMHFVRVDNNTKLVLMLEIFQHDGEKFYKVGYCL